METINFYIVQLVGELDDDPKLTFRKTKNEREEVLRFKVAMGVMPDYF